MANLCCDVLLDIPCVVVTEQEAILLAASHCRNRSTETRLMLWHCLMTSSDRGGGCTVIVFYYSVTLGNSRNSISGMTMKFRFFRKYWYFPILILMLLLAYNIEFLFGFVITGFLLSVGVFVCVCMCVCEPCLNQPTPSLWLAALPWQPALAHRKYLWMCPLLGFDRPQSGFTVGWTRRHQSEVSHYGTH